MRVSDFTLRLGNAANSINVDVSVHPEWTMVYKVISVKTSWTDNCNIPTRHHRAMKANACLRCEPLHALLQLVWHNGL